LKGNAEEGLVAIHGNIVVEAGDLMFLNTTAGIVYGVAADNYGYPFTSLTCTTAATAREYALISNFLGVAMESSPSGVTENITVTKSGVFRFPLVHKAGVTVGALVSAVSSAATTSTSGVSDQHVAIVGDAQATTAYLGYVTKTQSGASYVDFQIRTAFGPAGVAT
jgi:predicted RecA/RadA family phage recombinase